MPGPTITPKSNLRQLRSYVEHVTTDTSKSIDVLFDKAAKLGDNDQIPLMEAVILSANGLAHQAQALSMLHQALVNTYGELIAAHVFGQMTKPLYDDEDAVLSTALIDSAQKLAEQKLTELSDVELKQDIKQDPAQNPNVKNNKGVNYAPSKKKPKKNFAGGQNAPSALKQKQTRLVEIQKKTKEVKDTINNLADTIKKKKKKDVQKKKELIQKRLHSENKKKPKGKNKTGRATRRNPKDDNKIRRREADLVKQTERERQVTKNKEVQATLYLDTMALGGNKSFGELVRTAAKLENVDHWMNDQQNREAKNAIRSAFQDHTTDDIARWDHNKKSTKIAIPALRKFLADLKKKKT